MHEGGFPIVLHQAIDEVSVSPCLKWTDRKVQWYLEADVAYALPQEAAPVETFHLSTIVCLQGGTAKSYWISSFQLPHGRTVRSPIQILKELLSKEVNVPKVTSSYQCVLELRERLDETMKLAQAELERNQIRNLYNRMAKKRVFQVGDKVLVLLPTDLNKLLMQWKEPFEVK